MFFTGYHSSPDHIPYRCPGLEVPSWPCPGLLPRSLLSHQGTRSRSALRSMELFVRFARTSTRQARAFSVVGPSVGKACLLALQLIPNFHSDLRTALFSRARVGIASEL